jgi:hypothetical protein
MKLLLKTFPRSLQILVLISVCIPLINIYLTWRYPKTGALLNLASAAGQIALIAWTLYSCYFLLGEGHTYIFNSLMPG